VRAGLPRRRRPRTPASRRVWRELERACRALPYKLQSTVCRACAARYDVSRRESRRPPWRGSSDRRGDVVGGHADRGCGRRAGTGGVDPRRRGSPAESNGGVARRPRPRRCRCRRQSGDRKRARPPVREYLTGGADAERGNAEGRRLLPQAQTSGWARPLDGPRSSVRGVRPPRATPAVEPESPGECRSSEAVVEVVVWGVRAQPPLPSVEGEAGTSCERGAWAEVPLRAAGQPRGSSD